MGVSGYLYILILYIYRLTCVFYLTFLKVALFIFFVVGTIYITHTNTKLRALTHKFTDFKWSTIEY